MTQPQDGQPGIPVWGQPQPWEPPGPAYGPPALAPVPVGPRPAVPGPGLPPPPSGPPPRPVRIDPVPGTPFGVAYLGVSPTVSGIAVGSMVAGIGSVLISLLVYCFGLAGARGGWGPLVSGAFAILAGLVGAAAVATGIVAMRQIRRAPQDLGGRGLAVTGVACGGTGVGLTVLGFLLAAVVSHGQ